MGFLVLELNISMDWWLGLHRAFNAIGHMEAILDFSSCIEAVQEVR